MIANIQKLKDFTKNSTFKSSQEKPQDKAIHYISSRQ